MVVFGRFTQAGKRQRASELNERGRELDDAGRSAEAAESYRRACSIDPTWSVPFYNLGLLHKYRGEWAESLAANLRATQLNAADEAGWWNLGIAATALGRWDVARQAWRGVGIEVPSGQGPIDFRCGETPVRLDPRGEPEVVWCERLDPVRARIANIPLGDHCFGDVVLHDGAANGYRLRGERECPVFDMLELLETSPFSTFAVEVRLADDGEAAVERLCELANERGLAAEDWTASLNILCKACSEGRPHDQHDHAASQPAAGPHQIAIAARSEAEATQLLSAWQSSVPSIEVSDLEIQFSRGIC